MAHAHVSVTLSEGPEASAPREVVSSQTEGATCADIIWSTFGKQVTLGPPSGSHAWAHVMRDGVVVGRVWGYFGSLGDLTPEHLRASAR